MKQRSVASVIILTIVTFGIYGLVWQVKTKGEMNKLGAQIPTAWLIIVPIANIWWLWKYCEGVGLITKNKLSAVMSFVLLWLVGLVGMAIIQHEFNQLQTSTDSAPSATPAFAPSANNGSEVTNPTTPAQSVTPETTATTTEPSSSAPTDQQGPVA